MVLRICTLVTLTLLACIIQSFLLLPQDVSGDGTGDFPPPGNGNWTVSNDTFISNETITLFGNLRVKNNASLTLENVTIIFISTVGGAIGITVEYEGSLKVFSSNITAQQGYFIFNVFGDMRLEGSQISRVTGGIFIEFGNVTINNCFIFNNTDYAISGFGNPVISNNTIFSNYGGILTGLGSAPFLYKNTIFDNEWGIICNSFSYATIIGCNISHNIGDGIVVELGNLSIHDNIISFNGGFGIKSDHAVLNATNNTIFGNQRWGIYSLGAPIINESNHFEKDGIYNEKGDVIQEWEVLFHVFDTKDKPIDNVNITVYDQHGVLMGSANTTGNVRKFTLREYEKRNNGTLLVHTPFTINATKGNYWNISTLDIVGSEMSIIKLNTHTIYLDVDGSQEPDEVVVTKYEFPQWGLVLLAAIWILVVVFILIGIAAKVRLNKGRKR